MTILRTDLRNTRESAKEIRFAPVGIITATDVQEAISQVSGGGGGGTPVNPTNVSTTPFIVTGAMTLLYVDSTALAITILLPPEADRASVPIGIKDIAGHALSNNITIIPDGSETIDGLPSVVINAPYGGFILYPRSGVGYAVAP